MRGILFALAIVIAVPALAMKTYGPVKRGDSLWNIAVKNRPARTVSVQEMVHAIEKLNPTAFRGRGATSLKVGATLMVPTTAEEVTKALHPSVIEQAKAPAKTPVATEAAVKPLPTSQTIETTTLSTTSQKKIPLTVTQGPSAQQSAESSKALQLNQEATQAATQSSDGGVPWSWLWFIICVIGAAYFFWYRRYHDSLRQSINKGLAAARLGISGHRRTPVVNRYKTRRFKDKDAMSNHFQAVNKTPFSHSSADALAAATIDMAELEYTTAEQNLRSAILKDKKNVELRMKLLELYVKTNNRIAFKRESDALEHFVSDDSSAWSQVRAMYLNQWAYD